MSDPPFHSLNSDADWAEVRSRSEEEPVLLFKHSSACPVSGSAKEEMHTLAGNEDVPVYKLVVQESRALSDEIADTLDVRHETPQVILLDQKEAVFDTSHFDVTADTIQEAVQSTTRPTE